MRRLRDGRAMVLAGSYNKVALYEFVNVNSEYRFNANFENTVHPLTAILARTLAVRISPVLHHGFERLFCQASSYEKYE